MGRVRLGQIKRLAGSLRPGKGQALSFQHKSLKTPGRPRPQLSIRTLGTAMRTISPPAQASIQLKVKGLAGPSGSGLFRKLSSPSKDLPEARRGGGGSSAAPSERKPQSHRGAGTQPIREP